MACYDSSFALSAIGAFTEPAPKRAKYRHSKSLTRLGSDGINTAELLAAAKSTRERLATELRSSVASGAEREGLKRRLAKAVEECNALQAEDGCAVSAVLAAAECELLIEQALHIVEQADTLNLGFLFDATASMQPHIDAVKAQISSIASKVISTSPNVSLQVAFVAYRDHCDTKRFELHPSSADITAFEKALHSVAAAGGGDDAEDVLGGLQQALQLDWDGNNAGTMVLIHITDAPCHGTTYHSVPTSSDDYPAGDPHGLRAADLLTALSDRGVQYVFGRLNSSTDLMIKTFNSELKRDYISTCDMSNEESIQVSVITAARGSMARTASARRAGGGKKLVFAKPARDLGAIDESCDDDSEVGIEAFAITAKPVDWSAQEACAVVLYTNDPVTSMDQLKAKKKWKLWSRKAAPTGGIQPQDVRVQVAPQPFAQGVQRWALKSSIKLQDGWRDAVVKLFKDSSHVDTRARYLAQTD
jgi:von Willebrand factor type A domain